jgi:ferredoxin
MKSSVNPQLCVGCRLCTEICPSVFTMSGSKSIIITDTAPSEAEAYCRYAMDQCPLEAITVD